MILKLFVSDSLLLDLFFLLLKLYSNSIISFKLFRRFFNITLLFSSKISYKSDKLESNVNSK